MIIKKSKQKIKEQNKTTTTANIEQSFSTQEPSNTAVSESVQQVNTNNAAAEPEFDLFNIENIDFTQRQERRRGSRRRGYRRIDDRNLVSRAQEESENIKKSAFEEGYRLGLAKAETDMAKFRDEFSKFMSAKKEVFEFIAPDILEISVDIAKKIIKKELETDPQLLLNTIIDVLKTVSKSEAKVTIRVNPQSVQFVKDSLPNITYEFGIDSKITITSDPSIDEGGCIFQTNNGIVDASIDTQLEIIKKALQVD